MLVFMYPLTLDLVDFLFSEQGKDALDMLAHCDLSEANSLSVISNLRKIFTREQASALLDQARLRLRAREKFERAAGMWFTEEALQQATHPAVARYHTELIGPFCGDKPIADLGCGIGGDALSFATRLKVIAIDVDPIRLKLAEANAMVCGLSQRIDFRCVDWTATDINVNGAYIDPGRRISTSQGDRKRVFHLSEMQPPLSAILYLQHTLPNLAVKVAPGVRHKEIPGNAEVTFVSVRGQMKEALLRFGDLHTGASHTAVLLPGNHSLDSLTPVETLSLREPGLYLFEPDAAIIRAGLVAHVGTLLGLAQLDSKIAYLTSDHFANSPFVKVWCVKRSGSFLLKKLNIWLRELGAGRVIIKKRGSPVDVDKFQNQLKLVKGGPEFTVFFTRVKNNPWMVVADQCNKSDGVNI